jgi:hypothetical protein
MVLTFVMLLLERAITNIHCFVLMMWRRRGSHVLRAEGFDAKKWEYFVVIQFRKRPAIWSKVMRIQGIVPRVKKVAM